jgi:hypothetical protein
MIGFQLSSEFKVLCPEQKAAQAHRTAIGVSEQMFQAECGGTQGFLQRLSAVSVETDGAGLELALRESPSPRRVQKRVQRSQLELRLEQRAFGITDHVLGVKHCGTPFI